MKNLQILKLLTWEKLRKIARILCKTVFILPGMTALSTLRHIYTQAS